MKIAIDARLYGLESTGIGRYLENLLRELVVLDKKNEYLILLRKSNYSLFQPKPDNFRTIVLDTAEYTLREQFAVPAILSREKPDLVHFPHFNIPLLWSGKYVLTLHDLTMLNSSSKVSSRALPVTIAKNLGLRVVLNQGMKRAKRILVPSEFVKNQAKEKYSLPDSKVVVTSEAVDPKLVALSKEKISQSKKNLVLSKYALKDPYLLYVGTFHPHKNLERFLLALKDIDSSVNLVLVGKKDHFARRIEKRISELGLEERVSLPGFVPDDELVILYKNAVAFVFPSLSEGFGLPGLEAMSCGSPVIAAKSSSLPEVYGAAAEYFDPTSTKDISSKISQVIGKEILRASLVTKGYKQLENYSWVQLATKTLQVYKNALSS